jgi:predicted phosphodiesterase
LRNELNLDLERSLQSAATGILITGDIAFAGVEVEYNQALLWIRELCAKAKCSNDDAWVIPGNHDVDRTIIQSSPELQRIHALLRQEMRKDENRGNVDIVLQQHVRQDRGLSDLLFAPLRAYNDFAAKLGCQIDGENPFWQQDFSLSDGSTLRIRGLTSVLVSDHDNDLSEKLFLGANQLSLTRSAGVEYVTLCHHPPSWLFDEDSAIDALKRAKIQLYGHKHRFRHTRQDESLVISAGAMQPNPREPQWQPRYNILEISVSESGGSRKLVVKLSPRVWNDANRTFQADFGDDGSTSRVEEFELSPWNRPTSAAASVVVAEGLAASQKQMPEAEDHDKSKKHVDRPNRVLTYRFLTLPYVKRIQIAYDLGLFTDADRHLSDAELWVEIFQRARASHQLTALWEHVEKEHNDNRYDSFENPFRRVEAESTSS